MIGKCCKKIGIGLASLIALLIVIGVSYQLVKTKLDEGSYPPPGQMVDIGGYRLHLRSMGTGGPAVILDTGLGGPSPAWGLVQPEIAKFTQVVSYDRAGNGWSDASPFPRTSRQIIEELHTLLMKANIPKPYTLVGHSFGGNNVQLYAATYPDEVEAIVLVDSCHEEQLRRLPPSPFETQMKWMQNSKVVYLMSALGFTRALSQLYSDIMMPFLPESLKNVHLALCFTTKHQFAVSQEALLISDSLKQLEEADRSLIQNKPCVVLAAGLETDMTTYGISQEGMHEMKAVWDELQKELASKFVNSRHLIAEHSDHMISFYQPELIVRAVKDLVGGSASSGRESL